MPTFYTPRCGEANNRVVGQFEAAETGIRPQLIKPVGAGV
jgi:hypothetical protein